jgi:hypothetical protein
LGVDLITFAVALADLSVVTFAVFVLVAFAFWSAGAAVLAMAPWLAAVAAQAVSAKRTAPRTLTLKLFIALGLPFICVCRIYLAES